MKIWLTYLGSLAAVVLIAVFAAWAFPIGGTTNNEIMPGSYHHYYGGMKIYENTDAQRTGDIISAGVRNTTAGNNVTIRYVHISIFQL